MNNKERKIFIENLLSKFKHFRNRFITEEEDFDWYFSYQSVVLKTSSPTALSFFKEFPFVELNYSGNQIRIRFHLAGIPLKDFLPLLKKKKLFRIIRINILYREEDSVARIALQSKKNFSLLRKIYMTLNLFSSQLKIYDLELREKNFELSFEIPNGLLSDLLDLINSTSKE